ncbi:uncharacterized protein LOC120140920 [Hibiscus syriacus]|uniref:uncharacterized protein LOC120140920 n=1 Tax=Hibiscus syriacus TaxID=106335 RepID=UPI001920B883|nr:uncharacterized protein LOC120140920 [Hibiscus syriacus]
MVQSPKIDFSLVMNGQEERVDGIRVTTNFLMESIMPSENQNIQLRSSHGNVEEQGRYVDGGPGDRGTKTLRQLQAEEDDEERFQADLKKAVHQSLETYQARQRQRLSSNSRPVQRVPSEVNNQGVSANEISCEGLNETDVFGTGLLSEVGEYNYFLNVIIQSLWHLRQFRDEFFWRSASDHAHVGDPCVVCALYEIFTALTIASSDARREPVAPTSLRIALSNLYPDSNFFQEVGSVFVPHHFSNCLAEYM